MSSIQTEIGVKHPDDRSESGQWTESFPPAAFRAYLAEHPRSTTNEVAEGLGCSYKTAFRKISALKERGEVESRRAGNAHLWSLTEEGAEVHEEEADQEEGH